MLARHPNFQGEADCLLVVCAGRTMAEDDYEQFYKADLLKKTPQRRDAINTVKPSVILGENVANRVLTSNNQVVYKRFRCASQIE